MTIRVPLEWVEEVETMVKSPANPKSNFTSASHAVRECTTLGIQVLKHSDAMKDPAKHDEFVTKMQEMIKTENFSQFTETLDVAQLDGFLMMLKMEKEKRYEQGTLR